MMRFFEILSFLLAWGYTAVFFLILKSFLPLRKNVVLKVIAFLVCGYLADSIIYSNDAGKLKEVDLNKTRLEREIDSLPADAKYRERKLHDMTLRLDSLYDVIVELEEKIEDARLRRDAIKQQAITLENIYKIMVNFDCVYNIINDEEKRNVVTALIKEIEIYRNDESEYPLKRIGLNFPVFKDGGEVTELLWDKGNTVETVCLLVK